MQFAESMLRRYDKNEDGVLKEDEWREARGIDAVHDRDGDGSITKEELAQLIKSRLEQGSLGKLPAAPAASILVPQAGRDAAGFGPSVATNAAPEGPVERLLVFARHAPAIGMAETLNRHFGSSPNPQVRVVADATSNSLLIAAAPELLKEITAAIEQLDRAPARIELQIIVVEQARQEVAGGEDAPSRPANDKFHDEPLQSGPAKEVLDRIEQRQALGKASVVHRVRLTMLENQQGLVQIGQNRPVVHAITNSPRGETRNVNYHSVGLLVSATARAAGENAVAVELKFEKSDLATRADDPPLAVSSGGEKIPSTRTVTSTAQTTVTIPRTEAVVLADVSSTGPGDSNRLLLVVTAAASGAGGKMRD
jgi:hypothetical protein